MIPKIKTPNGHYYDDIDEMDDDKSDDDLKDLVIVDENYDDESEM